MDNLQYKLVPRLWPCFSSSSACVFSSAIHASRKLWSCTLVCGRTWCKYSLQTFRVLLLLSSFSFHSPLVLIRRYNGGAWCKYFSRLSASCFFCLLLHFTQLQRQTLASRYHKTNCHHRMYCREATIALQSHI